MKCIQCGSEWSVSDKLKSNIIKCPFCNADLHINEPHEIVDALIEWGSKEGLNFFNNSMKINGLLADLFPNKGRERNVIKIALEKGIGAQIVQLHHEGDESIKLIRINQMKRALLEEAWLSESAADFVVNTLITASDMVEKTENAVETKVDKLAAQIVEKKELNDDLELAAVISAAIAAYEAPAQRMGQSQEVVSQQNKKSENSIQDQIAEMMEKAQKYEDVEEFDAAVSFYKKASILGATEAAYRIAQIFSKDESQLAESIKWYTRAAEQGHNKAQNNLGNMYENAEGVTKDFKKAIYWYEKSAMSGNRNAQNNLAFCYYRGIGTPVNYKKAFEWYTKAAEQGHPGAQNNLGTMYEYGYGVEKNIQEAIKWYSVAYKNGSEDGKSNYKRCEEELTQSIEGFLREFENSGY